MSSTEIDTFDDSITSNNNSNDIIKGKRFKSTKKDVYGSERIVIVNKINDILGINDNDRYICKDIIESNEEFKKYMSDNVNNIKKMWCTSTWGYYSEDPKKGAGNLLTLYKSILKNSDYTIISKQQVITINNEKKKRIVYYIKKN